MHFAISSIIASYECTCHKVQLSIDDIVRSYYIICELSVTSLVPRPHPLTRRNGLVNQVESIGLGGGGVGGGGGGGDGL